MRPPAITTSPRPERDRSPPAEWRDRETWAEAPRSPLPLGGALAALTPIFAANPDGHLLLASSPTRVLDLLALPFPDAGVQVVVTGPQQGLLAVTVHFTTSEQEVVLVVISPGQLTEGGTYRL